MNNCPRCDSPMRLSSNKVYNCTNLGCDTICTKEYFETPEIYQHKCKLPSDYHVWIIGHDKDGKPVKVLVDVYALQNSLKQSPQVAHAQKKLWMPGGRNGGKDYKQDIEEARNQLNMELKRLDDLETLNED